MTKFKLGNINDELTQILKKNWHISQQVLGKGMALPQNHENY